jgi:hypothetical protein
MRDRPSFTLPLLNASIGSIKESGIAILSGKIRLSVSMAPFQLDKIFNPKDKSPLNSFDRYAPVCIVPATRQMQAVWPISQ